MSSPSHHKIARFGLRLFIQTAALEHVDSQLGTPASEEQFAAQAQLQREGEYLSEHLTDIGLALETADAHLDLVAELCEQIGVFLGLGAVAEGGKGFEKSADEPKISAG